MKSLCLTTLLPASPQVLCVLGSGPACSCGPQRALCVLGAGLLSPTHVMDLQLQPLPTREQLEEDKKEASKSPGPKEDLKRELNPTERVQRETSMKKEVTGLGI